MGQRWTQLRADLTTRPLIPLWRAAASCVAFAVVAMGAVALSLHIGGYPVVLACVLPAMNLAWIGFVVWGAVVQRRDRHA